MLRSRDRYIRDLNVVIHYRETHAEADWEDIRAIIEKGGMHFLVVRDLLVLELPGRDFQCHLINGCMINEATVN